MFTNFRLLGRAVEPAAYEMSKQRLQQHTGVDMNLFMVKNSPPMQWPLHLPSASPESRHLWRHSLKIIIIVLSFQAATTCIMIAFVALPTLHPTRPTTQLPLCFHYFRYSMDVTKQGEGECSVCISPGMCGEALSSGMFYTRSSLSECLHPPTAIGGGQLADLQLWHSNI